MTRRSRYVVLTGPALMLVGIILWHSTWIMTIGERDPELISVREHQPAMKLRRVKSVTMATDTMGHTTCAEKTDVLFIKVHKAGSSTVSNILQRFGTFRKLNFVLPKKTSQEFRYNYIGNPGDSVSMENIMLPPAGERLNILCNHVTYNRTSFHTLFRPATRYFYLSIVRSPVEHFFSVIRYYGYSTNSYIRDMLAIDSDQPLSEYLKNPGKYEPESPHISFTNNRQSLDLGLPTQAIGNVSAINAYFDTIQKDLDFVMLLEYFDESLIYLKRTLCWSYKDILYFPKNGRWNEEKYNFTILDLERLRKWNSADHILYDKFHSDFWVKVRNEGPDFFDEVLHFKRIIEAVRLYCVSKSITRPMEVQASIWEASFTVTNIDCLMLGMDELQFLDKIYYANYGIVQSEQRKKRDMRRHHEITSKK